MKRVAIIGAGASGMVAAKQLANAGDLEIVVFERGNRYDSGALQRLGFFESPKDSLVWEVAQFLQPAEEDEPRFFSSGEASPPVRTGSGWPGVGVGGGTLRWAAASWRFRPEDFDLPKLYTASAGENTDIASWPAHANADVFHNEYYAKAESLMGVAGQASEHDPVRAPKYPRPPLGVTGVMKRFLSAAREIDNREDMTCVVPLAIDTTGGCNPGTQCAPCMGYVCPFGSGTKFNTGSEAFIREIPNVTLRSNAVVRRIMHAAGAVTGVEYMQTTGGLDWRSERFDVVIVACAALESARLLLLSNVPNGNDLIGRFLTFHVHPTTIGLFDDYVNAHYKYHQAATTNYTRFEHSGQTYVGGLVDLNATYTPHSYFSHRELLARAFNTHPWGQRFLEKAKHYFPRHISLGGSAEDISGGANRVLLYKKQVDRFGRPAIRIVHKDHAYNRVVFNKLVDIQRAILGRMGATSIVSSTLATTPDHHQHGTLRMSEQRSAGVVNPYCEAWELRGLFVVDGSVFPSSGCVNPTLTIVANAIRVCDYIMSLQ